MTAGDDTVMVQLGPALSGVVAERAANLIRWGEQRHPDGTNRGWSVQADRQKQLVDRQARQGRTNWADILLEEVYEALAEEGAELREELTQVAAVATAWIEDIDSREEG